MRKTGGSVGAASLGSASLVVASLVSTAVAVAHPVWPGHYEEIPYGVDRRHPYPTGGASPRRDGRVRFAGPVSEPSRVWQTALHIGRPSAPAVSRSGHLYVSSAGGVHALSPTGELTWSQPLGFVAATPSLAPTGDVVVGTQSGDVVAVSPQGEVRFRTSVGGAVRGSPLVLPDGSIVVSTFDRHLHRIDSAGRVSFRVALAWPSSGSIAWDGRSVFFAGSDRLMLYSADGVAVRTFAIGAPAMGGPSIAPSGIVWVLGQDMTLRRIDPEGFLVGETAVGRPVSPMARIAIARDGSVRIPTRGDALVCIDSAGAERWQVSGEGSFLGGAIVDADSRTYAVTDRGVLLSVDESGGVLWRVRLSSRSDVAPVLGADGTLYVVDIRGTVYAWR